MTRDDIIRTAREAGLFVGTNISGVQLVGGVPSQAGGVLVHLDITELESFAAMVVAAEREACAQLLETTDICGDAVMDELAAAIRARGDQ